MQTILLGSYLWAVPEQSKSEEKQRLKYVPRLSSSHVPHRQRSGL